MSGARSTWIAARARNAARRGGWIAGIGGVSAIVTLLAFVVVPRELDRQLRGRIEALPAPADSMQLVRQLDSLRARQRDTLFALDSALLNATILMSGGDTAFALQPTRAPFSADSRVGDLEALLERARDVPLPDSYRAIADSPLMRDNLLTETRVDALVDSIDRVDREREAHAALGGPGARYAALTARLTAMGQRLIRLAEQRLAEAARVHTMDSMRMAELSRDSGSVSPATPLLADSARRTTADSLTRLVEQQTALLVEVRREALEYEAERSALEARLNIEVPPFAMLISALVVGVALGYGTAFAREVRWPTVGDALEVERVAGAQVLVHSHATPLAPSAQAARRERRFVPRIIDQDSDTFLLLHLALSGVGDAAAEVDVLADDPVLAAGVAMGTAAAAARESRAVLVVESATLRPMLAHLLRAAPKHSCEDVLAGRVSPDEAVHVVTLDRDTRVDTLVAGSPPMRTRRTSHGATTATMAIVDVPDRDEPMEALQRFEQRYDLRLYLTDPSMMNLSPARDVVLCVRQDSTPLLWLSRITQQLRSRQQRVRAVVVWSRDLPTVS